MADEGVKFDKMKIAAVNAMPGVSFAATAVVEVEAAQAEDRAEVRG